ncbi:MAG TPA: CvpA family protein [Caulobacteraceae bacterium]|nr:CvpA family protein [Caulobacteraceae bacterium]
MTPFDLIALLILGVSTLVGFIRGALREVATVVSFVAAVAVALIALRYTAPIARTVVHAQWAATAAALVVVFLASYIVIRVLTAGMMRGLHNIRALGVLDRIVGAGFGLLRGLVVLGLFFLGFNLALPATGAPPWIAEARLYPLARTSADALVALAPKGSALAGKLTPVLSRAVQSGAQSSDSEQSGQSGYDRRVGRGIDEGSGKSR